MNLLYLFSPGPIAEIYKHECYLKTILKSLGWTHVDDTPWIWKQKCQEYLISHLNREKKQNPGPHPI